MFEVVLSLTSTDFDKNMTTHTDHRVWQDVYRTKIASGDEVYLELTVIGGVLIVSFKEFNHEMPILRRGGIDPRHARSTRVQHASMAK